MTVADSLLMTTIRNLSTDREEWPYAVIGYHLKDLEGAKAFAKGLRANVIVRATGEVITP